MQMDVYVRAEYLGAWNYINRLWWIFSEMKLRLETLKII